MAESISTNVLRSFLECSLCLHKFEKPKQLKCNHHFCQQCLERIVQFNDDGSGNIVCPLRCKTVTTIGKEETINDLPVSYEFKGLLEALQTDDDFKDVPKCSETGCLNPISIYCCSKTLCLSCYRNHQKNVDITHTQNFNLNYNRLNDEVNVLCDVHATGCNAVCSDGKFVCVFCLNREDIYKNNPPRTVKQEVESLRRMLNSEMKRTEKVSDYQNITEKEFVPAKENLKNLLECRKEDCLMQYSLMLENEMAILTKMFNDMYDRHMEQYPENIKELNFLSFSLSKSDILLGIEKSSIIDVFNEASEKVSIYSETISLGQEFDYLSLHPLGDFILSKGEEISFEAKPSSSIAYDFGVENDHILKELSKYNVDLPADSHNTLHFSDTELKDIAQLSVSIYESLDLNSHRIYLDLKETDFVSAGSITMELYPWLAPKTCKRFFDLHAQNFYQGSELTFHREKGCWIGGPIQGFIDGISKDLSEEKNRVKNDSMGIVSISTDPGQFHFYITVDRRRFDDEVISFGKVTAGSSHVLRQISTRGRRNSRSRKLIIVKCGYLKP